MITLLIDKNHLHDKYMMDNVENLQRYVNHYLQEPVNVKVVNTQEECDRAIYNYRYPVSAKGRQDTLVVMHPCSFKLIQIDTGRVIVMADHINQVVLNRTCKVINECELPANALTIIVGNAYNTGTNLCRYFSRLNMNVMYLADNGLGATQVNPLIEDLLANSSIDIAQVVICSEAIHDRHVQGTEMVKAKLGISPVVSDHLLTYPNYLSELLYSVSKALFAVINQLQQDTNESGGN